MRKPPSPSKVRQLSPRLNILRPLARICFAVVVVALFAQLTRETLPHWLYWGVLLLAPLACLWYECALGLWAEDAPAAFAFPTRGRCWPGMARISRGIDRLSRVTGHFVAYWTVIAIFVYFFEVMARYFFNAPTNWAHESMFLMFGMQYLLSGAFTHSRGGHVRVDVLYSLLSLRARAVVDVCTHFFFLCFTLALIWTGWTFFAFSMDQNRTPFGLATGYAFEVSFSQWAVVYFPAKFSIVLGACLLLLQGISQLIKDLAILSPYAPTLVDAKTPAKDAPL